MPLSLSASSIQSLFLDALRAPAQGCFALIWLRPNSWQKAGAGRRSRRFLQRQEFQFPPAKSETQLPGGGFTPGQGPPSC